MKKLLCIFLGCLLSPFLQAQSLTFDCNHPRSGDYILKRMVTACEPGESGVQRAWDFSRLELQDANYELKYMLQSTDTVIGIEHRTIYYYRTSGDSLFCLGYENPMTSITYQKPELLLAFPIFQGRIITDYFDGKGNYCEKLNIRLRGKSTVTADASGILVLPGGDTLYKVLRTYTHKRIHQRMTSKMFLQDFLKMDTIPFTLNRDSIEYLLANDSIYLEMKTWRWYANGYRYPVFETVKNTVFKFNIAHEHFTTSFVYLPDEQYYELSYDTDNQERRDIVDREQKEYKWKNTDKNGKNDKDDKDFNYNFKINHDGDLRIDYELKQTDKEVTFILFDLQGRQLSKKHHTNQFIGHYNEIISMDRYFQGEYLLRIIVGEKVYREKLYYVKK